MLRFCLVGCGAIGRIHTEILLGEGAIPDWVVGRNLNATREFASEFGFAHAGVDVHAAFARDTVDVVIVASPNDTHFSTTRAALLAGKDVLAEIPLALSYREAVELVELADRQRRVLMVAHSERFIPSLAAVRERVARGELHIHHVIGHEAAPRRENVGWTGRQRSWTDSLLWHFGCHVVDFGLWLTGAHDVEVVSQAVAPLVHGGEPFEIGMVLRTPADQLLTFALSFHSHFQLHDYLIVGEEESLRFDRGRLSGPEGVRDDPAVRGEDYYRLSWDAQDREFLAAVRERRQPLMSGADALPALAVLQTIQDRFQAELAAAPRRA